MVAKQRKPHMLRGVTSDSRPTNFIFFDTETTAEPVTNTQTRHHLRLGVALHCRTIGDDRLRQLSELVFRDKTLFWSYVERSCAGNSTLYLVAHNIIFDLVVVDGFNELVKRGWKMDSFYVKNLVSILHWSKGKRKVIMLDNSNLFAGKLADWGEAIKLEKLSVDFETVGEEELERYCKRDVLIMVQLWRTWLSFLDENQCGSFKPTVSSTAFTAWRRSFLRKPLHIHANCLATALERDAYHGGRVEVLYQGKLEGGDFYYLDVNSMYGYVLSRYLYPVGFVNSYPEGSLALLEAKLSNHAVVARVTVSVDESWFPYKLNRRTCYPLGTFITTLTTPELMLAYNRGWIQKVHEMAYYKQASIFSAYVKHFASQRAAYSASGKDGFARICKLLVNGLYGKFGQQAFEQKIIGETSPDVIWETPVYDVMTGEHYRQIALAGYVYEEHKTGEAFNAFPAIAAHVTAYARLVLGHMRNIVPAGHLFYMDTDSLIVDEVGYKALGDLLQPGVMGKLKIEYQARTLEIFAPKDYVIGERVRSKGIRPDARETSKGIFEQEQWTRLNGMLRRGDVSDFTVTRIVKHQQREIFSGTVQPDGWVAPFVLQLGGQPPSLVPLRENARQLALE